MKKILLNWIFLILISSIFLLSCASNNQTENIEYQPTLKVENLPVFPKTTPVQNQIKSIDFKGVYLQTEIPLVTEIEAVEEPAIILQSADDKPQGVQSRHISLKLKGDYANQRKEFSSQPEVSIYRLSEFREAFKVEKEYVKLFDTNISVLQKLITEKKATKKEIPNIPWYEGTPEVLAHFKHLTFENGEGIFYITQFNVDYATIINNQQLLYIFQGLTTDKKFYIRAAFPVTLKGLPENIDETKVGDFELSSTYFDEKTNPAEYIKYKNYLSSVENLLNNSESIKFTPNLDKIEKTISSLTINWNE